MTVPQGLFEESQEFMTQDYLIRNGFYNTPSSIIGNSNQENTILKTYVNNIPTQENKMIPQDKFLVIFTKGNIKMLVAESNSTMHIDTLSLEQATDILQQLRQAIAAKKDTMSENQDSSLLT